MQHRRYLSQLLFAFIITSLEGNDKTHYRAALADYRTLINELITSFANYYERDKKKPRYQYPGF